MRAGRTTSREGAELVAVAEEIGLADGQLLGQRQRFAGVCCREGEVRANRDLPCRGATGQKIGEESQLGVVEAQPEPLGDEIAELHFGRHVDGEVHAATPLRSSDASTSSGRSRAVSITAVSAPSSVASSVTAAFAAPLSKGGSVATSIMGQLPKPDQLIDGKRHPPLCRAHHNHAAGRTHLGFKQAAEDNDRKRRAADDGGAGDKGGYARQRIDRQ